MKSLIWGGMLLIACQWAVLGQKAFDPSTPDGAMVAKIQKENDAAQRLFQFGVADFELGKASKSRAMMQDALKFSQQAAALKSPIQEQAQNNVKAISRVAGVRR